MFVLFRKIALVSLLILTVLTTGAWQNNAVVPTERQNANLVEPPLYPGLTWSNLGSSTQNIRINIKGDSISVSGERFEAQEQFLSSLPLPQDLVNYYSNAELAKSGWVSYDAFDGSDGVHYVFYHESGVYLSVEYLKCPSNPERTCVAIWMSEPMDSQVIAPVTANTPENLDSATTSSFSKTSPVDGAADVNASSVTLKWESYSSAQKYTYCIQTGSDCVVGTADWTSTYNTSVTLTNLVSNKTYYWQVRALTCGSCTPKTWVYANSGDNWSFQTQTSKVAIVGNAGLPGAVLSYVDGTTKKVTADSSGAYSITVPYKWSGTVTPSKSGYLFSPTSASFSNLTASQTIQNFTAIAIYTISGNAGVAGVTLSYTDGTPKTATSDAHGNYTIIVPTGWSGTVIPSHNGFPFTPASRTYVNLTSNQVNQNYTDSWMGGVSITSDKNVVTVARPHVGNEIASYNGFSNGSLTSYVPMLFKTAYGSYDSALYIQNVHTSNTAHITIKYYDNNGTLNCTKTDTITPLASKGYWVPSETCDSGSLPAGWVGGVVVTSDQPIVAVGRPHIGTEVMTYDGFTSGGLTMYFPMLFKGAFSGSYDSALYLQNTDASNVAHITIKYYDNSGTLNCTKTDTIIPLASKGYWVPSATCDSGSLPAGWVGGVVVTSDHSIVGVGRLHIGSQVTTYNGFTTASLSSYLPMLFKGAFSGSYDSAFYIQNTATDPASVTIKFYDSNGALSCTRTDTIPGLSTLGYWIPSVMCNS